MRLITSGAFFVIILGALFIACTNNKPPIRDELSGGEKEVFLAMQNWAAALMSGDVDECMKYYSDNFSGTEAKNKEEMRELLNEAKFYGMLLLVEVDLETADLEVKGDSAEIVIYNDDGELEMDFALTKEGNDWRIIGIPSEICNYDAYAETYGDDCVDMGGHYRCWNILEPKGLSGKSPLVIDFHGWTEDPLHQQSISGFDELAEEEDFVVVWPYGLCSSWNAGPQCCVPASDNQIDDIAFIREMIKKLSRRNDIDPNRVYLTGLSNGCAFAQRFANEASDLVAAVACMSLHLLTEKDPNYKPVPVMTIMGTNDDLYLASEDMPGAMENFERWKEMNNCRGTYEVTWASGEHVTWTYKDCDNESEVALTTINGGGHLIYRGTETDMNTTQLAWDFMKKLSN